MVSRIKERLLQYKQELQKKTMYKEGLPGSSLDIVNSLLDDLEEDEKENGWIPVKYHQISEKERAEEFLSKDIQYMLDGGYDWIDIMAGMSLPKPYKEG